MIGKPVKNKKYFIEVRGKGRIPLQKIDINPQYYPLLPEVSRLSLIWLYPEGNPVGHPLHQYFIKARKAYEDSWNAPDKDDMSHEIPEVLLIVQGYLDNRLVTFTKLQLLNVHVEELFRPGGNYEIRVDHYSLKFRNYLEANPVTLRLQAPRLTKGEYEYVR